MEQPTKRPRYAGDSSEETLAVISLPPEKLKGSMLLKGLPAPGEVSPD
jgi:hypothetical protein